jgi:hypothetical protein
MAKTTTTRQTSNKSGVQSTAEKLENSRHGFGPGRGSHKVAGASGEEPKDGAPRRRRAASAPTGGKAAAAEKMRKARQS